MLSTFHAVMRFFPFFAVIALSDCGDDGGVTIRPLNDTGITTCSNSSENKLKCRQTGFEWQDADYGRDTDTTTNDLAKDGPATGE